MHILVLQVFSVTPSLYTVQTGRAWKRSTFRKRRELRELFGYLQYYLSMDGPHGVHMEHSTYCYPYFQAFTPHNSFSQCWLNPKRWILPLSNLDKNTLVCQGGSNFLNSKQNRLKNIYFIFITCFLRQKEIFLRIHFLTFLT